MYIRREVKFVIWNALFIYLSAWTRYSEPMEAQYHEAVHAHAPMERGARISGVFYALLLALPPCCDMIRKRTYPQLNIAD